MTWWSHSLTLTGAMTGAAMGLHREDSGSFNEYWIYMTWWSDSLTLTGERTGAARGLHREDSGSFNEYWIYMTWWSHSLTLKNVSKHQNCHPKSFSSKFIVKDRFFCKMVDSIKLSLSFHVQTAQNSFIYFFFFFLMLPCITIWQRFTHQ